MPESSKKRYRVVRGFAEPDHENGVDLLFQPDGRPDADPAKSPCSVYVGTPPKWYLTDDPDAPRHSGLKGIRCGGDGAGPLLVEIGEGEPDGPPAQSANKDAWVEWAVSQGADSDAASTASKNDLIAQYGADSAKGN